MCAVRGRKGSFVLLFGTTLGGARRSLEGGSEMGSDGVIVLMGRWGDSADGGVRGVSTTPAGGMRRVRRCL